MRFDHLGRKKPVALPHLIEETTDSDALTEWAVCIFADKTWMHTPEALAKHYIPYNAKVCFTFRLLHCVSFGTVKWREAFCCSTMVGGFYCVQFEIYVGTKQNPSFCGSHLHALALCQAYHTRTGVPWYISPDTAKLFSLAWMIFLLFLFFMEATAAPFTQTFQVTSLNS